MFVKHWAAVAAAITMSFWPLHGAQAQEFPNKPITLLHGFGAGGNAEEREGVTMEGDAPEGFSFSRLREKVREARMRAARGDGYWWGHAGFAASMVKLRQTPAPSSGLRPPSPASGRREIGRAHV